MLHAYDFTATGQTSLTRSSPGKPSAAGACGRALHGAQVPPREGGGVPGLARRATGVWLAAMAAATCTAAADIERQPWLTPPADPLRLASLPFDPTEADVLAPGRWEVGLDVGYFNLWYTSWHTATIHRELGLVGTALAERELRILELRHSGDDIFHLDMEGTVTTLSVRRGLGRGLTLSATLPWIEVGRPRWDAISGDVHRLLGWNVGNRDVFPRGETSLYVWSPSRQRAVERGAEVAVSGPADLRLALSGPLGTWLGGSHRWVAAADVPLGDMDTVAGSGGVDVGIRWIGGWEGRTLGLSAGAGLTRLDRHGAWLGVVRHDTWHLLVEGHALLGARTVALLGCRVDASPLAGFSSGAPGNPALVFTLGVRREAAGGGSITLALNENVPHYGVAPDFSLHVRVAFTAGKTGL